MSATLGTAADRAAQCVKCETRCFGSQEDRGQRALTRRWARSPSEGSLREAGHCSLHRRWLSEVVRHLKAVENQESSQAGTAGNACVLTFDKISACRTPRAVMLDVYRMPPTAPSSLFTLPLYWWRPAEPAVTSCLRYDTGVSHSASRMRILNSTSRVGSSICIWPGLCTGGGSLHCKHSALE